MRIPILTNLYEKWRRYRSYKEIISLHNAINEYRTDLKDFDKICKSYPEAAVQRDRCKQILDTLYRTIDWKMRRYRILYPKKA